VEIVVCDTGLGNVRSVVRALRAAAAAADRAVSVTLTADAEAVLRADRVVVPGQGAFGDCSRALDGGLGEALLASIRRGTPYLGICLGLQILFGTSEEEAGCRGLGLFDGDVVKLPAHDASTGGRLKIPHMGWNTVDARRPSALVPAVPTHFYFVHSYAVAPRDETVVAATTDYGAPFVSAIERDNVFACQFHPEKSQRAGLALLERFVRGA
jgi:glutamine amidotransferase